MHFNVIHAVLGSLVIISVASLPGLETRTYCVRDKCHNRVNAGPKHLEDNSASSSARKDCSSFLEKTVTPCPVTITITVTSLRTGDAVTVPVTETQRTTRTIGTTITLPITTTITPTTTETSNDTLLVNVTATVTEGTTTILPTTVETEVVTQSSTVFHPEKRAVTTIPARYSGKDTDKPKACHLPADSVYPSYQTATKIPYYASCDENVASYSSACSCLGVVGAAATVPPATSTETITITRTIAPTITQTTTVPEAETTEFTSTITTLITLVGEEETTTEVSTVFVTSTATTSTTKVSSVIPSTVVTSTTLVTVPSTCPFFQLQAVGGAIDGQYVLSQGENQKLAFTAARGSAAVFHINDAGQLTTGVLIASADSDAALSYVYIQTQTTIDGDGDLSLICQKTPSLTCATSNGSTRFVVCLVVGPGGPSPGPALLFGTGSYSDCGYISLTTLPAPQCP
ncbi:hypothetical protein BJ170DRAFT_126949 [Xylariales sp. AK1849]|nr:hypothetical protein BJ170DRAFT_126949 [Xylariales sp. AK1849]